MSPDLSLTCDEAAELDLFTRQRPRLVRIAYRMLGSIAESEDIAQDAWLRWRHTDRAAIREPAAYLARIVTRLCLDHLKSARVKRETYVGAWLPEPLIEDLRSDDDTEAGDGLTLTLMLALERLSPLERAAFLLHDVFDLPFDEVARAIDREPAACRQLASRARARVRDSRPRYTLAPAKADDLVRAFFSAATQGNIKDLQTLLAEDVVAYSDGGGQRPATINPIYGLAKVARFFAGLAAKPKHGAWRLMKTTTIDGLPGVIACDPAGVLQTTALDIRDGKIAAIFTMRNPDKLRHVEASLALHNPSQGGAV